MDISLFQLNVAGAVNSRKLFGISDARATTHSARHPGRLNPMEKMATNSRNLDLLRSFAVLLVVGFHLAKFLNWHIETLRVTDFGMLGVMLFFVHTTLVLMFSLERQSTGSSSTLFVPFMIRRCFRIYPLAILLVTFAYLFQIPSDLQFGRFNLLHQSAGNFLANLLLIQNVTREKANPGILWSLPLELQMYLVLPALFLLASRVKSSWALIAFWWSAVALWFAVGLSTGVLPLSEGGIRSPAEALLKFTRFAPCFLPGIVAYKLWRRPRFLPASSWPAFLVLCCAAFLWLSGNQPVETGWFICFAIGLGVCSFREMRENPLTRLTKRIARYSYGIYLFHYFAIWIGFAVCRRLNVGLQIVIFGAVLAFLTVLLYHTVEAPLIAAGVKVSQKLMHGSFSRGVNGHSAEPAAQIFPDLSRSS
jgi:peptidoglycan/LPS O-acetylase OafA/YrhL